MTQKAIGPSFADELAAAGLSGLPFSWTSNGDFAYGEGIAAEQIGAVQAIYAAHDPNSIVYLRSVQSAEIDAAYAEAVQQPVSFKTSAGVVQTFQTDTDSQTILSQATQGYQIAGGVPANFFWKASDNTLVPFTLADLEGLYTTILAQGWAAFQRRTTLKAEIDAATTVAAVRQVMFAEVGQ